MMHHKVILAAVAAIGLIACASELKISEIPNDLAPGSVVNGIPFRMTKRYNAIIYEKRNDGYKEVARSLVTLPDPDHLYLLGFHSQLFSNSTVDLVLNADNTIQQVLEEQAAGA